MNKIIVEKEEKIQLTNNVFNLEIKTAKVIIEITGKVLINEIINTKEDNVEIIINLNIKLLCKCSIFYIFLINYLYGSN